MATSVIKKPKMSGISGTFTPESGVTLGANETRIRQTGDVVEVHFYATFPSAIGTSETTLGSISGVTLPPRTIRTITGGGAAAYSTGKPLYLVLNNQGKVAVTNVLNNSGITTVAVDITYTVD